MQIIKISKNTATKYNKPAFILHMYGYIWKVIINKPNCEFLYANEFR